MNQEYCCPYCGQNSYAKTSKNNGAFSSWQVVIKHIATCSKNNKSFLVDKIYGPIPVELLNTLPPKVIKVKYPKLKLQYRRTLNKQSYTIQWSKETIISAIKDFYSKTNRIPAAREFDNVDYEYPTPRTVRKYFGTWNTAIEAAGFKANTQSGFGINTIAKDGNLYRSKAEAYFCDNFLFEKYKYVVEPKYPEPHNKYYDWYIPSLDLYIELDGNCRPEVVVDKRILNKQLGRNCLFIDISEIYKKQSLQDFL